MEKYIRDKLDILKEVGSIAACYGSTALSDFLKSKIILNPPLTDIIHLKTVPSSIKIDKVGVTIFSRINVGLKGEVIFILDENNAYNLIDLAYNMGAEEKRKLGLLTEMGVSIMKELGNMVIGSYLTALSLTLNRMIVPPLPTLISGSIEYVLDFIFSPYSKEEFRYLIQSIFSVPDYDIKGYLCLILPTGSVQDIKDTCKKMLEDMSK